MSGGRHLVTQELPALTPGWALRTQELPALTAPARSRRGLAAGFRRLAVAGGAAVMAVAVAVLLGIGVGPAVAPYKVFSVLSGSMAPTMPVGSLVVDGPVPGGAVRAGDVVTFERPARPGDLVTHRVVRIVDSPAGPAYVTRGDANGVPDPWTVPARGTALRVVFAIPALGYGLAFLHGPWGRLLFVMVPSLFLAAFFLVDLWRRPSPGSGPRTVPV